MKRILVTVMLLLSVLLISCSIEEAPDTLSESPGESQNESESEKTSEISSIDTSAESDGDSSRNQTSGNSNVSDNNYHKLTPLNNMFSSWSALVENELKNNGIDHNKKVTDLSAIGQLLNNNYQTAYFKYEDYYFFGDSYMVILILPLTTDEDKARPPYCSAVHPSQPHMCSYKTVITDIDEYNNRIGSHGVYKYTKEGVDIYMRADSSGNLYHLVFRIGDYRFVVHEQHPYKVPFFLRNNTDPYAQKTLLTAEMYEKIKPLFEECMPLYEIGYIYDEKSELVRILKEAVEKAEQGDHVTE